MSDEKKAQPKGPVGVVMPADDSGDGAGEMKGTAQDDSKPERRLNFVTKSDIDDTTLWFNQHKDSVPELTPQEAKKTMRKNFWFLLLQTWWIAFLIHLDKSTLSSASTMGMLTDTHTEKNQFNHLFTIFYAGYLIALWPGAALSQRIGHKWFIIGSLLLWSLLLGLHPLATRYSHLIALRFFLGMVSLIVILPIAVLASIS